MVCISTTTTRRIEYQDGFFSAAASSEYFRELVARRQRGTMEFVACVNVLICCVINIIPETYTNHHFFVINFYLTKVKKNKEGSTSSQVTVKHLQQLD